MKSSILTQLKNVSWRAGWVCTKRSKHLPEGGEVPDSLIVPLEEKIQGRRRVYQDTILMSRAYPGHPFR
jgi:hypothetical protein